MLKQPNRPNTMQAPMCKLQSPFTRLDEVFPGKRCRVGPSLTKKNRSNGRVADLGRVEGGGRKI